MCSQPHGTPPGSSRVLMAPLGAAPIMRGAAQHLKQYILGCITPLCPFQEAALQDLDLSFNLILLWLFFCLYS